MLNILVVCTGNICRSPLVERLLTNHLVDIPVRVASAGTRARAGAPMTPEATHMALQNGCEPEGVARHTATLLDAGALSWADWTIAMDRSHRRQIVELQPGLMSRAFTLRELARLVEGVNDDTLLEIARRSGDASAGGRAAEMLTFAATRRGVVEPPASPEDDDVVDPYRRSGTTYERSTSQILSALPTVERLARLAVRDVARERIG
ncbi:low molecular weight phosphatase family protein [Microbacterium testaceum]|uniref:arsenate reductase/protein-tyrosine-phosphatase family protein n=1 Tax=Microbacterium testaceum TaxID=2033 RepID=UPI000CCECBA4|nr:low molecular weight phosphatase family protein [Microbacterium testaceum]PNW08296.1 low molecular weight phosphatase family protein [Microbacterium testaceum]